MLLLGSRLLSRLKGPQGPSTIMPVPTGERLALGHSLARESSCCLLLFAPPFEVLGSGVTQNH